MRETRAQDHADFSFPAESADKKQKLREAKFLQAMKRELAKAVRKFVPPRPNICAC